MNGYRWFYITCVIAFCMIFSYNLRWGAEQKVARAALVLDCVNLVELGSPVWVSEANPDYVYEAPLTWCNAFIDAGGRDTEMEIPTP